MIGEMSMPPKLGRNERIGRNSRLGDPVEKIADHRDAAVPAVDDAERQQPAQDRLRDQQPDIDVDNRIDQPEDRAHSAGSVFRGARDRSRCPLRPQAPSTIRPPALVRRWGARSRPENRLDAPPRALYARRQPPSLQSKIMAAYQYIYVMKGLRKTYPGGREVLRDIWLSFLPGAKIGVLGLNGAGKSTLLRIMAGEERDFSGEAWAAEGARVGFLPQEPALDPDKDVAGNVMEGLAETKALLDRFEAVSARFAEDLSPEEMDALIAEQGELQEKIDQADAWELDRTVEIAMDALRCPPGDTPVANLSGGERRRVALCRLLLQRPDLLLLDEPTNHLDAESVAWLQRFLKDYPGTVVTVTHDRYFLDEVAGWILELDRGHGIPFEGNYSGWLEQKQARLAQEGRQEEARRRTLERELEWVRQSPRARQAKSKARLHGLRGAGRAEPREGARDGADRAAAGSAARRSGGRGRACRQRGSATGC